MQSQPDRSELQQAIDGLVNAALQLNQTAQQLARMTAASSSQVALAATAAVADAEGGFGSRRRRSAGPLPAGPDDLSRGRDRANFGDSGALDLTPITARRRPIHCSISTWPGLVIPSCLHVVFATRHLRTRQEGAVPRRHSRSRLHRGGLQRVHAGNAFSRHQPAGGLSGRFGQSARLDPRARVRRVQPVGRDAERDASVRIASSAAAGYGASYRARRAHFGRQDLGSSRRGGNGPGTRPWSTDSWRASTFVYVLARDTLAAADGAAMLAVLQPAASFTICNGHRHWATPSLSGFEHPPAATWLRASRVEAASATSSSRAAAARASPKEPDRPGYDGPTGSAHRERRGDPPPRRAVRQCWRRSSRWRASRFATVTAIGQRSA